MRQTPKQELESQLRKIVLASGDIRPEQVKAYLRDVTERGSDNAQAETFLALRPLADHLTQDYVDYALSLLLREPNLPTRPSSDEDSWFHRRHLWGRGLLYEVTWGEALTLEFRDPLATAGPFLFLLRHYEKEGLRLLNGLINGAVARWRQRQSDPAWSGHAPAGAEPRTPLPIIIELENGPQEFWGDDSVLSWKTSDRYNRDVSHAIASALLALEEWMNEQVEAECDVKQLFQKVLFDSDSIATLKVCFDVVEKRVEATHNIIEPITRDCLQAVFPLMTCPALWWLNSHRVSRFAYHYALSNDSAVQQEFRNAVKAFPQRLPFLFEEEQHDASLCAELREKMEECLLYASSENYRGIEQNGVPMIGWIPPKELVERREPIVAPARERLQIMILQMWGAKAAESGEIGPEFTPEGALAKAQELQRTRLSAQEGEAGFELLLRRDPITAVAAALIVNRFEWLKQTRNLQWCRNVLLKAPYPNSASRKLDENSWDSLIGISMENAIYGLVALVKHGAGDIKVKDRLLWMALSDSQGNVETVFKSLLPLWGIDPVLCWNILDLRLAECLSYWRQGSNDPDKRATERLSRQKQRVREALNRIKKSKVPTLTQIPVSDEVIFFSNMMADAIPHLPFSVFLQNPVDKERFLLFFDNLMQWTITANSITREREQRRDLPPIHKPYEWNPNFFDWAVQLGSELDEQLVEQHILKPVRENWLTAPQLTADLLHGYIRMWTEGSTNLTPNSLKQWEQISSWVFDGYKEVRSNWDVDPDAVIDTAAMLMFGSKIMAYSRVPDDWPHSSKFQTILDRWVRVIGPDTDGMHFLLVLLKGAGRCFWPTPALDWMCYCVQNCDDSQLIWWERNNCGERSSQLLMEMWHAHEQHIRSTPSAMRNFAWLTDHLVQAHISLASHLQAQIERIA